MRRIGSSKILEANIYGRHLLTGTTNQIIPLSAPVNTILKDAKNYPEVDLSEFNQKIYRETAMIIRLQGGRNVTMADLEKQLGIKSEDRLLQYDRGP